MRWRTKANEYKSVYITYTTRRETYSPVHITGLSEECNASIISVKIIDELGKTLATTSNRRMLRRNTMLHCYETLILTRATRRNIPEDGILHSHRRENFKSYISLTGWAPKRRRNVSPVRYGLGFYIPEDDILDSHRSENLRFYIILFALFWGTGKNPSFLKYLMTATTENIVCIHT
jgi:hypothetical protein